MSARNLSPTNCFLPDTAPNGRSELVREAADLIHRVNLSPTSCLLPDTAPNPDASITAASTYQIVFYGCVLPGVETYIPATLGRSLRAAHVDR